MDFRVSNVAITAEDWVARAVEPKSSSAWTHFVHVQEGIAYATNRRRMHWGATVFPDGTYDPASFMPTQFDGEAPDFVRYLPDWAEFIEARIDGIEDASPGPKGEAIICVGGEALVNKIWLLEAMNGKPDRVFVAPHRVAGVGTFGHFMIAQVSNK